MGRKGALSPGLPLPWRLPAREDCPCRDSFTRGLVRSGNRSTNLTLAPRLSDRCTNHFMRLWNLRTVQTLNGLLLGHDFDRVAVFGNTGVLPQPEMRSAPDGSQHFCTYLQLKEMYRSNVQEKSYADPVFRTQVGGGGVVGGDPPPPQETLSCWRRQRRRTKFFWAKLTCAEGARKNFWLDEGPEKKLPNHLKGGGGCQTPPPSPTLRRC